MREAARTVEEAGVEGLMSRAIAEAAGLGRRLQERAERDLAAMLDAINRDISR